MLLTLYFVPDDELTWKTEAGTDAYARAFFAHAEKLTSVPTELKLMECEVDHANDTIKDVGVITIDSNMAQAILTFIIEHRGKGTSFDCHAFANLAAGVKSHMMPLWSYHWETRPCHPEQLQTGDTVFLYGDRAPKNSEIQILEDGKPFRMVHTAICIAENLFVSVYGKGGDIELSTFTDLQKTYTVDAVRIATPLPKTQRTAVHQ